MMCCKVYVSDLVITKQLLFCFLGLSEPMSYMKMFVCSAQLPARWDLYTSLYQYPSSSAQKNMQFCCTIRGWQILLECVHMTPVLCASMSSTFTLTQTYFGSKIDADLYIYKIASLDSRAVLHYYIDQITKCGNPVHVLAANKHH